MPKKAPLDHAGETALILALGALSAVAAGVAFTALWLDHNPLLAWLCTLLAALSALGAAALLLFLR